MRSTTRRAFCGVMRTCRSRAMDSTMTVSFSSPRLAATALLVVLLVPAEGAGGGELAELVPDHRLRHEHGDVLATVVHRDGVTEHRGDDHRATRPGADDLLRVAGVLVLHLRQQVVVDEGALLQAARHATLLLLALLADGATADDELVALLVRVPGAALRLPPRAHRVATAGGLALTTAVRVVDRVHRDPADGRADALPAVAAGLAPVDVRLLGVADLADRGAAAGVHVPDLAGREAQLRVRAVLRDEPHRGAGGAGELGAAARTELDRVHHRADGDAAERQVVARLDVGRGAGLHDVALREAVRREDVALLAVHEVQQRDARGAVRVVLDVRDAGVDAVLVGTAEVDEPVLPLVTAADVAGRDAALVVAAAGLRDRAEQALLGRRPGDLGEVGHGRATTARGGRLVVADCHVRVPPGA